MDRAELLKYAYTKGLEKAVEEAGITKEARIGLLKHLGSLLGFGGKGTLGYRLAAPLRPITGLMGGGPGAAGRAAHQALGFGTFGGALGALGAEEGDRLGGFARGFGLGTIGGLGWHGGSRLAGGLAKRFARPGAGFRGALHRVTSPETGLATMGGIGKAFQAGMSPAEAAKLFGARGLVGLGTFGAGMGASMLAEQQAEKYIPALRHPMQFGYRQLAKAPFAAAQVVTRGRLGLTPGISPGASSGTYPGAY